MRPFTITFAILVILCVMLVSFPRINTVRASGTIHIREDGSVDPPDAPIQRDGDVYTLIGNVSGETDGIRIERDNMTLDGAGYTIEGAGAQYSAGVYLSRRSNVTIKTVRIQTFTYGILFYVSCFYNVVNGNVVTGNDWDGVKIAGASGNNSIVGNNITENNGNGIGIYSSSCNSIIGNNVTDNVQDGIILFWSSNNTIHHNTFVNNTCQVYIEESYDNIWDDGYPSGGNLWSNYTGVDADGDGIGDTPYTIDPNNQDRYPMIPEFSPLLMVPLFIAATLLIACRRKHSTQ